MTTKRKTILAALRTVSTDAPVHVVAIVDTAEIAVKWASRS